MSEPLYIVGGRLLVTDSNSQNTPEVVSYWGVATTSEVTVIIGYGRSEQYGDNSAYYQNIFLDTKPGPWTIVGGRIQATTKEGVMPTIEVTRWGAPPPDGGQEVTIFQAFGWTGQYGESIVTVSYFLGTGTGVQSPITGGRWMASSSDRTQPWVVLASWGQETAYEVNVANCFGWSTQYGDSYVYQNFFVAEMPNMGLQNVVSYPTPIPFPSFTEGTQPAAYQYILQQLTDDDILSPSQPDTRALIAAQAAADYSTGSLSDAYAAISKMSAGPPPVGVTQSDWEAVTGQLMLELVMATKIIPLYKSNDDFLTKVFIENLDTILQDAAIIDLAGSDTVAYNLMNILSGAVEIVASVSTEGLAAVAWTVSSLVSTVVAEIETNGGMPTVEAEAAELEQALKDNFNQAIAQNELVLQNVVTDWGKLSAVDTLYNMGLVWPDDDTAAITALTHAYEVTVWQSMLPIKFALFFSGNYYHPPGPPCQWQQGAQALWLGLDKGADFGQADDSICNKLFGTGTDQLAVPMADVFQNQNGWHLIIKSAP